MQIVDKVVRFIFATIAGYLSLILFGLLLSFNPQNTVKGSGVFPTLNVSSTLIAALGAIAVFLLIFPGLKLESILARTRPYRVQIGSAIIVLGVLVLFVSGVRYSAQKTRADQYQAVQGVVVEERSDAPCSYSFLFNYEGAELRRRFKSGCYKAGVNMTGYYDAKLDKLWGSKNSPRIVTAQSVLGTIILAVGVGWLWDGLLRRRAMKK